MTCECTRRHVIRSLFGGSLLLPGLIRELVAQQDPLAPRPGHAAPRAQRVIFIFLQGGVSHLDSFDYKPRLGVEQGKKLDYRGEGKDTPIIPPQWEFRRRGKSGMWVSELFPHIASIADDLCLINTMHTNIGDHFQDTLGIHAGSWSFPKPSLGSWISYGLGTANRNLPSFVVIAPHLPYAGGQLWGSDFLPGYHQGTRVVPGGDPIPNLKRRSPSQERELGLLAEFNRDHLALRGDDPALMARIKSFETAAGMQMAAPEAFDVSREPDAVRKAYGSSAFGWQCLAARRLAERGVRFIELIDVGASANWDAHGDMSTHAPLARNVDQPIAALVRDLKMRGMLDDTLVVFATEFGRTPNRDDTAKDGQTGRGHQASAYSMWLAGGGVKAGTTHGKTDDLGRKPVEGGVHVHDLHATILHLLGLDHERLTYRHAGRDFRLTDVHGNVVKEILA